MDLSLESLSCPSVLPEHRYFINHDDSHSLLETMVFNDQADPASQLPAGFWPNSFTTSASSDPIVQEQFHALPTQYISHPNLQLDDMDAQGASMGIEGIWRDMTVAEERVKKRREQNRASQRSYRQRKDKYIQQLERQNKSFQQQILALHQENEQLRLQRSQFTERLLTNGSATHMDLSPPSSPAISPPPSSPATMDWYGGEHLDSNKSWNVLQGPRMNKGGLVTLEDVYGIKTRG
ncbi:hypothetical protein N431DRAFT_492101 [Stipitochalara longipes BDJ]|nr:hypothetical protein N431DRAFT_492101 [Stipitochalara longipes BDJ]